MEFGRAGLDRREVWVSHLAEESWIRGGCDSDAGARNRREHRDFQRRLWCPACAIADAASGAIGDGVVGRRWEECRFARGFSGLEAAEHGLSEFSRVG